MTEAKQFPARYPRSVSMLVLAYGCSRPVKSSESVALEFTADSPTSRWSGVEGSLRAVDTVRVGEEACEG